MSGEQLVEQLGSLDKLANSELKPLTDMAELLYNLTQCLDLKVKAMPSESELLTEANKLSEENALLAGKLLSCYE